MQILGRKVLEVSRRLPLFYAAHSGRAHAIATLAGAAARWAPPATSGSLATAPWAATQRRGAKMLGSDGIAASLLRYSSSYISIEFMPWVEIIIDYYSFVSLANLKIQGHIYQVIKAQHSHQGRGGATIQVELRDVDTGNKITERFRTDEALESLKRLSNLKFRRNCLAKLLHT
ncbi:Elongation factor P [Zea mays]|uniref:Elongation factor P n=1 Tax=Zea mays TaxID=4577 RepID=A0A1D6L8D5_MAIZE|nr:Elongation factor P [Zea mays]